ncbi:MAG: hypothetical protein ACE15B_00465 [Bryobacteraceae bacterium]
MIIAIASLVAVAAIVYIIGVRPEDLPEPEPVSPFEHLEERKTAIYENLRDLQFEYRVGKLSDRDYQQTKKDLQKELAVVMAEAERLGATAAAVAAAPASAPARAPQNTCPHCGATFQQALKYCGECGKPMEAPK